MNRSVAVTLCLAMGLVCSPGASAQEADTQADDLRSGRFFLEVGAWVAQPTGLEYFPVSIEDPTNPLVREVSSLEGGTETAFYYRGDFGVTKTSGIRFIWYGQTQSGLAASELRPGQYVFGEIQAHPLFAGFNNDGLADGYSATADTRLRDVRIEYFGKAFRSERARANWYVGIRRVNHNRQMDVTYNSILNNLPPQLDPPRPDLAPEDDQVSIGSNYEGRGISAGLEFEFPLLKRFSLEAGLGVTALRGEVNTTYTSATQYYVVDEPGAPVPRVIGPPYSEFSETIDVPGSGPEPLVDSITQTTHLVGLQASPSRAGEVLDTYVGFRFFAGKIVEVGLGFRTTFYGNVGVDLKPVVTTAASGVNLDQSGNLIGVNTQTLTEVDHNATYEGFYLSVGARF